MFLKKTFTKFYFFQGLILNAEIHRTSGVQRTNFAARSVRTSLMSTNQEKRKRGTKEMIENRNINIITDTDGKKLVLINDIRFKGKRQIWLVQV